MKEKLYKVTARNNGIESKSVYRCASKKEAREKATQDMNIGKEILTVDKIEASKERVFLSRSEVAEIYGVDPQTISNYVNKGVLKPAHCSKDRMMFDITMVESLRSSVAEIEQCQENVNKLKEELKEVQNAISEELNAVRATVGIDVNQKNSIGVNIIKAMSKVAFNGRCNRILDILTEYLSGKDISAIADDYLLSKERIVKIINKSICSLSELRPYDELSEELEKLKDENRYLKYQNSMLQKELMTSVTLEDSQLSRLTEDEKHLYEIFSTKILDLNISVRACNAMKAMDIETVEDLVSYTREELTELKIRNFGKKTIQELEDTLETMGLEFGMKDRIQSIRKKIIMQ